MLWSWAKQVLASASAVVSAAVLASESCPCEKGQTSSSLDAAQLAHMASSFSAAGQAVPDLDRQELFEPLGKPMGQ